MKELLSLPERPTAVFAVTDNMAIGATAGNPARHIRHRFDESIVERMLQIKWWDWPIEKSMKAMPMLYSTDIGAFIDQYGGECPI